MTTLQDTDRRTEGPGRRHTGAYEQERQRQVRAFEAHLAAEVEKMALGKQTAEETARRVQEQAETIGTGV